MQKTTRLSLLAVSTLGAAAIFSCAAADSRANSGVQIAELPDRLRVEINGQLFTEYFFKDVPRPYCYPILGPQGIPMTRNWPMKDTTGEDHDHQHHRSFWFAHGAINGTDFWAESPAEGSILRGPHGDEVKAGKPKTGKTVHEKFIEIKSGADSGRISSQNKWVAPDGTVVCTDDRTLRIYNRPDNERLFDFEITLHPAGGDLTFGDTKEGTFALRLAETMRLKANKENTGKPGGHIVNSEGQRDDATWGKRAKWCDYYGPVGGSTVGAAIFDHPKNPRFPTWWHVRDYGLFAANPFGQHDFENLPNKTAGNLVVPAGQSVTFRYRVYLHEGDEQQSKVAEHYADFIKSKVK